MDFPELYFERDTDWYDWLLNHHKTHNGVYLIFYKIQLNMTTMRREEAVKVALCFGWIDSTVRSLGNGKRRQYFCPRNPKSTWSALNKKYIIELEQKNLIQEAGYQSIEVAKSTGKWTETDDVENGVIPKDLQLAFNTNTMAFKNFSAFSRGYQKSYLSWLHSAKREATRQKRIEEIINLCVKNIKTRNTY
ncbi:MAG: YdeI/OmpD-associated family protein [Bacteroidia bacterium]|nr:YdeI/OmpD-associated family protein [Bacteroidia bacterium]